MSPPQQPHPTKTSNSNTNLAALPTRKIFDPWNSSSTGHQRAEYVLSGSTSWRESRQQKLAEQFRGGLGGGKRVAETVGAGSENFGKDGRKPNGGWERGRGPRERGQKGIMEWWGVGKNGGARDKKQSDIEALSLPDEEDEDSIPPSAQPRPQLSDQEASELQDEQQDRELLKPQLFTHLTFHINGSTHPYISDHALRHLLLKHGASLALSHARRRVTHVILGTPAQHGGAGGGLAGSKLQKEIQRIRGKGVRYVGAEWVVESVKAGRRLPETRFAREAGGSKVGVGRREGSVYGVFKPV